MTAQSQNGLSIGDRPSRGRDAARSPAFSASGIAALRELAGVLELDGRPVPRLERLRRLREVLDELELDLAAQALGEHRRFEDIGRALGMSRSAAHRRFAELKPERWSRY